MSFELTLKLNTHFFLVPKYVKIVSIEHVHSELKIMDQDAPPGDNISKIQAFMIGNPYST